MHRGLSKEHSRSPSLSPGVIEITVALTYLRFQTANNDGILQCQKPGECVRSLSQTVRQPAPNQPPYTAAEHWNGWGWGVQTSFNKELVRMKRWYEALRRICLRTGGLCVWGETSVPGSLITVYLGFHRPMGLAKWHDYQEVKIHIKSTVKWDIRCVLCWLGVTYPETE